VKNCKLHIFPNVLCSTKHFVTYFSALSSKLHCEVLVWSRLFHSETSWEKSISNKPGDKMA